MARPRAGAVLCERLRILGEAPAGVGSTIFGRPLLARMAELDEDLWLTLVDQELLPSSVDVSRFIAGANGLLQLEHPGLCEVRIVDREADDCVVAVAAPMDAIALEELARTRCTPALIERLARELAAALAYLHSNNLAHGVLEPGTVFVGDDRCCTLQWGLVQLCAPSVVAARTAPDGPAQVCAQPHLGARADVHAWAHLLAFAAGVRSTTAEDPRVAWRELCQGLPRELAELVESAMDPDPLGRPPDGGVLAMWLGMETATQPQLAFETNQVLASGEATPAFNLPTSLEPDEPEPSRVELLSELMPEPTPPPPKARPQPLQSSGIPAPRPASRARQAAVPSPTVNSRPSPAPSPTPKPDPRNEDDFDAVLGGLMPVPAPALGDPPPSSRRAANASSNPRPATPALQVASPRPTPANAARERTSYRPPRAPGPHGPPGWLLAVLVGCMAGAFALGTTAIVAEQQQGLSTLFRGREAAAAVLRDMPPEDEATSAGSSPPDAASPEQAPVPAKPAALRCPEEMAAIRKDSKGLLCIDQGEYPGLRRAPEDDVSLTRARALCSQMGRRLCTLAEWQFACRGPGRKFPYGDQWTPDRCNFAPEEGRAASLSRGGARDACSTPEGVYDLLGNVGEWVDEGLVVGGDALTTYAECTSRARVPQGASLRGVGFRCCFTAGGS